MTDPQDLAALVAELTRAPGWPTLARRAVDALKGQQDTLDAQAAENARLTAALETVQIEKQACKDAIATLTARAEKAEAALSESRAAEEGAMMILTQTFAERDAARKALSESQALLATWPEVAANHCWAKRDLLADAEKKQVEAGLTGRDYYGRRLEAELLSRSIRALTDADAQAALDARIKEAKEEGYRDGWRFAFRQCQATGSVPDPDYKEAE